MTDLWEKTWYPTQAQMTQSLSHLFCRNQISQAHTSYYTDEHSHAGQAEALHTPTHGHTPRGGAGNVKRRVSLSMCAHVHHVCVSVCAILTFTPIFHNPRLLDYLDSLTHSFKAIKNKSLLSGCLHHMHTNTHFWQTPVEEFGRIQTGWSPQKCL